MTPSEFDYIKRAVLAIEEGSLTQKEEVKVLKIVSQITAKSAKQKEEILVDNLVG